jgi:hypothetical protein
MSQKDGGPAFPVPLDDFQDANAHPMIGMSLRDWFAGMAISETLATLDEISLTRDWPKLRALEAYRIADAMLAERAKGDRK